MLDTTNGFNSMVPDSLRSILIDPEYRLLFQPFKFWSNSILVFTLTLSDLFVIEFDVFI